HRLGPSSAWTTNHWQAAYEMAILDTLAGRSDARARWIGVGAAPGLHRSYRVARFAAMLDVLLARERAAVEATADRWIAHVAEGFARERAGNLAGASAALAAALASSEDGEFDCIVAAELA